MRLGALAFKRRNIHTAIGNQQAARAFVKRYSKEVGSKVGFVCLTRRPLLLPWQRQQSGRTNTANAQPTQDQPRRARPAAGQQRTGCPRAAGSLQPLSYSPSIIATLKAGCCWCAPAPATATAFALVGTGTLVGSRGPSWVNTRPVLASTVSSALRNRMACCEGWGTIPPFLARIRFDGCRAVLQLPPLHAARALHRGGSSY